MDGETLGSKVRDALVTIPAIWVILILAGLSGAKLQPGLPGAALSLAVCVGLLFAWGHWTGPGRRTALPVYLLAGLLYPALAVAFVLALPTELSMGALDWVAAGMAVGFQPASGPDAPGEFYLLPIALNLFGPILAMGLLRHWARSRETV
jgi:hypothetical protein